MKSAEAIQADQQIIYPNPVERQEVPRNSDFYRIYEAPSSEVTAVRPRPFNAIASDFDGVVTLYGKETEEEADRIRELMIQRSIEADIPLAFITGKDESNVGPEIIDPIREKIKARGIELQPGQFMVYANNGSITIDVGLDNQIVDKKTFPYQDLEKIGDLEVVQVMFDIYKIFEDVREQMPEAFKKSWFREEETTLGFSLNPEDLNAPQVEHLKDKLVEMAGTNKDLTRFDIGQVFREQLKKAGLDDITVAVTDGAIDLTPPGTGKRRALERFANKHNVEVENILRIGDNPTGSDYELLAPKGEESRGGFANVEIDRIMLSTLMNQNPDFRAPHSIDFDGNQFRRTIALLEKVQTVPASPSEAAWFC